MQTTEIEFSKIAAKDATTFKTYPHRIGSLFLGIAKAEEECANNASISGESNT